MELILNILNTASTLTCQILADRFRLVFVILSGPLEGARNKLKKSYDTSDLQSDIDEMPSKRQKR